MCRRAGHVIELRVWGFGFRVSGLGFRGLGFRGALGSEMACFRVVSLAGDVLQKASLGTLVWNRPGRNLKILHLGLGFRV